MLTWPGLFSFSVFRSSRRLGPRANSRASPPGRSIFFFYSVVTALNKNATPLGQAWNSLVQFLFLGSLTVTDGEIVAGQAKLHSTILYFFFSILFYSFLAAIVIFLLVQRVSTTMPMPGPRHLGQEYQGKRGGIELEVT